MNPTVVFPFKAMTVAIIILHGVFATAAIIFQP